MVAFPSNGNGGGRNNGDDARERHMRDMLNISRQQLLDTLQYIQSACDGLRTCVCEPDATPRRMAVALDMILEAIELLRVPQVVFANLDPQVLDFPLGPMPTIPGA